MRSIFVRFLPVVCLALPAAAEEPSETPIEAQAANPDAQAPAQLERAVPGSGPSTSLGMNGATSLGMNGATSLGMNGATSLGMNGSPETNVAAASVGLSEPPSEFSGKIPASLRLGYRGTSSFLVDDIDTRLSPSPLDTRLRVGPEIRYGRFGLVGEFDTAVGALTGMPNQDLVSNRNPQPSFQALDLRQAYLEYKAPTWFFRAGQQAANWGLGLVANNGAKDAAPGDFGESRFGDLSYRALLAGRPLYSLGGLYRAIEPAVGVDLVTRDDTANFYEGDRAFQGIFALRFAADAERYLGVYTVLRRQRAEGVTDGGRATDALVVDLAGKWKWTQGDHRDFTAGFEVVSVTGTSTMARSDTASVQAVRQFGAAVKAGYRERNVKVLLDTGYASGDQNPYDDTLEAFRFDPDYRVGLVLFDQVLGWQSARSAARAADPALVGVPPEGVDLLPTRGSVSGAWYLFPRAVYGVTDWLDVYGGPLFAFSTATLTDPFTSRVHGGESLNALGGRAGNILGTELDLGVQARFSPHQALKLSATAEGGLFFPGDAFKTAAGAEMGPVAMARIRLGVEL